MAWLKPHVKPVMRCISTWSMRGSRTWTLHPIGTWLHRECACSPVRMGASNIMSRRPILIPRSLFRDLSFFPASLTHASRFCRSR